jgi:phosphoketolase
MNRPLSPTALSKIDGYWRASNYLSIGQIYLLDNPLLREPLRREHVKPRLLGHWGTSPGLNLIYVHLNRVIAAHDLNVLFITGPGHGGPSLVAHAYLEGTYTEVYPSVTQDEVGMRKLFTQFSFPGGIPSHVAPETPGSIHEGGELGYALSHAFGAAFDNPELIVAAVVGDGEQHAVDLLLGSCAQHLAREIQLDLVAIVAIDVRKGEEEGSVKGVAVVRYGDCGSVTAEVLRCAIREKNFKQMEIETNYDKLCNKDGLLPNNFQPRNSPEE